jgi:hypothetical protein
MDKPIVQQIAENIRSTLAGVTKNAGYSVDLDVDERDLPTNNPKDNSCFVVQDDPEDETDESENRRGWYQVFGVVIYLIGTESGDKQLDARANEVWGDVYKQLMLDRTRGGLAIDTRVNPMERFPDCVLIPVRVHFETLYDDITQQ